MAIIGGTIFSTLSGLHDRQHGTLGSVLLPDMIRRGYHPTISMGPIMAVGGVAMLIPPSALAVLLASLAEQSVAKLLIAGIVPGVLMAVFFFAYVIIRCMVNPTLAPIDSPDASAYDVPVTVTLSLGGRRVAGFSCGALARGAESRAAFPGLHPAAADHLRGRGGKHILQDRRADRGGSARLSGIAGACFLFKLLNRTLVISGIEGAKFGWRDIRRALMSTAKINTMILFIIAGSLVFSQALSNSGATSGLLEAVQKLDLTPFAVVLIMVGVLLFLGAFMDQVSMLLLTLPAFFLLGSNSMQAVFHIDVLWLMVLMLITMEISLLTPPFGLLLYVMKGSRHPRSPAPRWCARRCRSS
ncbi:MAG: SLC13 family permease [Burkholderiaceae bacterium]